MHNIEIELLQHNVKVNRELRQDWNTMYAASIEARAFGLNP